MATADASNLKIVTKNFGVADSHKLSVYTQRGRRAGVQARRWRCSRRRSSTRSRSRTCAAAAAPASRPGVKWGFVPKDAKTVYLVINADESEPGTCKDRELAGLGSAPAASRACIIASYALGCKHAYIYIRGEMMRECARRSSAAIDEAYAAGLPRQGASSARAARSSCDITVHRGAGAYICGEETALLNSLEGKRG